MLWLARKPLQYDTCCFAGTTPSSSSAAIRSEAVAIVTPRKKAPVKAAAPRSPNSRAATLKPPRSRASPSDAKVAAKSSTLPRHARSTPQSPRKKPSPGRRSNDSSTNTSTSTSKSPTDRSNGHRDKPSSGRGRGKTSATLGRGGRGGKTRSLSPNKVAKPKPTATPTVKPTVKAAASTRHRLHSPGIDLVHVRSSCF